MYTHGEVKRDQQVTTYSIDYTGDFDPAEMVEAATHAMRSLGCALTEDEATPDWESVTSRYVFEPDYMRNRLTFRVNGVNGRGGYMGGQ